MGNKNPKQGDKNRGQGIIRLTASVGALIVIIFLSSVLTAQHVLSFKVVVNKKNPVYTMTRDEVSRIFLKKNPQWRGGEPMLPVDLISSNPLREIFSRSIHQQPLRVINIYWQKKIFTGTGLPPVQKMNDAEVLAFVSEHPGAIGYVSAGADLESVKELRITAPDNQ
jgi:ABC-type phosphate transport system substrate-binding protein